MNKRDPETLIVDALRAARTYIMDVKRDRSDEAIGTLEIIREALVAAELRRCLPVRSG